MKLQQLRFLLAVTDSGLSFTKAAERLFTSQSGVSKQIRQLEDELRLELFVRRGKRIESLTPAGERVVAIASDILAKVNEIRALSDELRKDVKGRLSLATTQTQARYALPPVITAFRDRFPEIDFELHQGSSEQIAQMMRERRVDFALTTGAVDLFPNVIMLPVYGWDRVAIVPTDHPLARIRSPLDLNLLAEHPLVTYIYSSRSESTFMKAFNEQGLTPRIAFTARDADVIKTYVRAGLGVGILAGMAIDEATDRDLTVLSADHLFPRLTTWIGFRRNLLLKDFHADFIQLVAPHLDQSLIEDLRHSRRIPDLDQLVQTTDLPSRIPLTREPH